MNKSYQNKFTLLACIRHYEKESVPYIDVDLMKSRLMQGNVMSPTLKGVLYKLVSDGFVEKEIVSPRKNYYSLTAKGNNYLKQIASDHDLTLDKDDLIFLNTEKKPKRKYTKRKNPELVVPATVKKEKPKHSINEVAAVESLAALIDENRKLKEVINKMKSLLMDIN